MSHPKKYIEYPEKTTKNGTRVVHPSDRRGVNDLVHPVAITIPGLGIVCYMEMAELPVEATDFVLERKYRLEAELERKLVTYHRLCDVLGVSAKV